MPHFEIWRKKPGVDVPCHSRIYVWVDAPGVPWSHKREPGVQCFTMERDPFKLKAKRFEELYEPEPKPKEPR